MSFWSALAEWIFGPAIPHPAEVKAPPPPPAPEFDWADNPEALRALERMGVADVVFLTGGAGTGKSTLIDEWRRRNHAVVLAPTAVAARRVRGATLHSFFRLKRGLLQQGDVKGVKGLAQLPLLVVDEISMVRADLFGCIEAILREYGPKRGARFGGVKIVLTGDLEQLPPVVERDLVDVFNQPRGSLKGYPSPWFFDCNFMEAVTVELIELKKNYRQGDDAEFARLLETVRDGSITDDALQRLNEACVRPRHRKTMLLCGTNLQAEQWNTRELAKIPGAVTRYHALLRGREERLQRKAAHQLVLDLKPGATVVFTVNDVDKRWINGDRGEVLHCEEGMVRVRVESTDGRTVEVRPVVVEEEMHYTYDEETKQWLEVVDAQLIQLPLRLGWAVTIHRAQGMTLRECHIDLSTGAFAAGQTYVALSRVRRLADLSLEVPLRREDIKTDPRVGAWIETLRGKRPF